MARIVSELCLYRASAGFFIAILVVSTAAAQLTAPSDLAQRPIPGVGHDYVSLLSETVNPADGSVNLEFKLPAPKDRGISLPFSLTYNSGALLHIFSYQPGYTEWMNGSPYSGGWSTSIPQLTVWNSWMTIPNSNPSGTCYFSNGYEFYDVEGKGHSLNMAADSPGPYQNQNCSEMGPESTPFLALPAI